MTGFLQIILLCAWPAPNTKLNFHAIVCYDKIFPDFYYYYLNFEIIFTRGKARFARLPLDSLLWKTNQFISIFNGPAYMHSRPNGTEQKSLQLFLTVRVSKRPLGANLCSEILFSRTAGVQRGRVNLYFD